jgi:hypothetical protein
MSLPQAEDIPARKRPRLDELLPTTTDEAARMTPSPHVSVSLPAAVANEYDDDVNADNDNVNVDPVTYTQPNAFVATVATWATGRWTIDEDAKLTNAVANTSKKKWGNEYKIDRVTISASIPDRTKFQCQGRWNNGLDSSIDGTNRRTGKWTSDEDSKLKDAVQMHDAMNWKEIAALVPGRTRKQCKRRWKDVLDPSIALTAGHTGKG